MATDEQSENTDWGWCYENPKEAALLIDELYRTIATHEAHRPVGEDVVEVGARAIDGLYPHNDGENIPTSKEKVQAVLQAIGYAELVEENAELKSRIAKAGEGK